MTPTEYFRGKTVLVTGAGGSIGSEICRELAKFPVKDLRGLGHSEEPLYRLKKEIPGIHITLGSVTDDKLMARQLSDVDIVIHAAAHKHVPLCEENPLEAIVNNVGGTMTLADAASRAGAKKFILVSSDKAVKPSSVMGATKRVCELFLQHMRQRSKTEFTTVRFGNVLNSSGSVLPLWREQLKAGKPITLTDYRCTRYFMEIGDAVNLTLAAATLAPDTYVFDMGEPRNLENMAIGLIVKERPDIDEPASYIREIGLRPGEKLTEELTYGETAETGIPRVRKVLECQPYRIPMHFFDLVVTAKTGNKTSAMRQLWEMVS